ncbi:hypothetical protein M1D52_07255 [Olivibacter sp. SA151]|uniref:hypothetical protein n=1 Tax=Olivibacter jilunii TaxID=985016 RepID=UPI003F13B77B
MIHQLKIQQLLRRFENKFISDRKVSQALKIDRKMASEILIYLESLGYIEKTVVDNLWQNSMRGKVLANKKIHREFRASTLQDHFNSFLSRAKAVNSSNEFPDYIRCALVTTEYPIKNKGTGVEIVYCLERKELAEKEYERISAELRKQHKGGFNNIVEQLYYPEKAIGLFLKSRSPILKLRQYSKEEIKEIKGYRLKF